MAVKFAAYQALYLHLYLS